MPMNANERDWPILLCEAVGESTDEDIEAYLRLLEEVLRRRERHVLIVDATRGKAMKGTHRQRIAAWNKRNAEALRLYRAGLVLVTDSAMLRGIVTAIYWISAPPFPYLAMSSIERARFWAHEQLEQQEYT